MKELDYVPSSWPFITVQSRLLSSLSPGRPSWRENDNNKDYHNFIHRDRYIKDEIWSQIDRQSNKKMNKAEYIHKHDISPLGRADALS